MKKTIIALAAVSSVALSHGVAVAQEDPASQEITTQAETTQEDQDNNETTNKNGKGGFGSSDKNDKDAKGSSAQGIFGWDDDASPVDKLIKIGAAVAAVVSLLGSISALFANIEKLVKQFTK